MTKDHSLQQTRKRFLKLGEKEFKKHGYANASTTRIVEASGMARGSLYYHFKDKQDLFRATYINGMDQMATQLQKTMDAHDSPDIALIELAKAYFKICADPVMGKFLMVEPIAVLGAEECQAVTSRTIRPVLTTSIDNIIKMGGLKGHNKGMMAMFLFSSLTESGRIISTLPNRKLAEDQFFETFQWVLAKIL